MEHISFLGCSFCGKKKDSVKVLISGQNAAICDSCIASMLAYQAAVFEQSPDGEIGYLESQLLRRRVALQESDSWCAFCAVEQTFFGSDAGNNICKKCIESAAKTVDKAHQGHTLETITQLRIEAEERAVNPNVSVEGYCVRIFAAHAAKLTWAPAKDGSLLGAWESDRESKLHNIFITVDGSRARVEPDASGEVIGFEIEEDLECKNEFWSVVTPYGYSFTLPPGVVLDIFDTTCKFEFDITKSDGYLVMYSPCSKRDMLNSDRLVSPGTELIASGSTLDATSTELRYYHEDREHRLRYLYAALSEDKLVLLKAQVPVEEKDEFFALMNTIAKSLKLA